MTPLVKQHCPHCGAARLAWTKGEIVEAMLAFAARRGRAPTTTEWKKATRWNPTDVTVRLRFGSFRAAIEAAGLIPHRDGVHADRVHWTRDRMLRSLRAWRDEHGRVPQAMEWSQADPADARPSYYMVRREFGSWQAALVLAGLPVDSHRRQRCKVPA